MQIVKGEGRIPNKWLLLGEAPSHEELRQNRPFVGATGKELDNYFSRNRLSRDMFRIENIVPYFLKKNQKENRRKMLDLLEKNKAHLVTVLQDTKPQWVITLGVLATLPFMPNVDMEKHHGIPFKYDGPLGTYNILPCYHPAAGLHDTSLITEIMWDISRIPLYLNVETINNLPTFKTNYRELLTNIDIITHTTDNIVGIDTETVDDVPWSVQLSCAQHEGYFVSVEQRGAILAVRDFLQNPSVWTILHNAKFDLNVLSQIGIVPLKWVDTMTMAYILQLPQSLKRLAYRYLQIDMKSYQEVTSPANFKLGKEYLEKVASMKWADPPTETVWDVRKKQWKEKHPQKIGKKAARLLKSLSPNDDLQEKWRNMTGTDYVERMLGKFPEGQLSDIPREQAIHYACQDADVTRQLYYVLHKLGRDEGLW